MEPLTPMERAAFKVSRSVELDLLDKGERVEASAAVPLIVAGLAALVELLKYCFPGDVAKMHAAAKNPGVWGRFRAWRVMRRVRKQYPDAPKGLTAGMLADAASRVAGRTSRVEFAALVDSVPVADVSEDSE